MTDRDRRIQQLAEEIGRQKQPDAYTIGRARGYLTGPQSAEVKLANIAAVFEAWDLGFAQASRDEADREDATHVVHISFNSGKYLVKCDACDLFDVAETLDSAKETRAAHEGDAS